MNIIKKQLKDYPYLYAGLLIIMALSILLAMVLFSNFMIYFLIVAGICVVFSAIWVFVVLVKGP